MLSPDKLHIHSHFHPLVRFSLIKKFYPIMLCIRVLLLAKLSFLTKILDMGHSFLFLFPFLYIDSLSHTFLSTIKKNLICKQLIFWTTVNNKAFIIKFYINSSAFNPFELLKNILVLKKSFVEFYLGRISLFCIIYDYFSKYLNVLICN